MGTVIQVNDVVFTSPNLPVISLPYSGITNGLLAAYQLRHSAALALDPVAGSILTPGIENGSPSWLPNKMVGGGSANSGIDTGTPLGNAYTLYSVFRRSAGSADAFGVAASYADRAMRLSCGAAGWRAQMTVMQSGSVIAVFNAADFTDLDALTTDATRFEFMAITVDPAFAGGFGVWVHMPRVGYFKRRVVNAAVTQQNPSETAATVTFASHKVSALTLGTCEVAAGGHFNRALSQAEVVQQYAAIKSYCDLIGIDI